MSRRNRQSYTDPDEAPSDEAEKARYAADIQRLLGFPPATVSAEATAVASPRPGTAPS